MSFLNPESSHRHSLQTLGLLYEYDNFMESVSTVIDFGCGSGLDLEWWATRTTRDDNRIPLNIKCHGVDTLNELPVAHRYKNIQYSRQDFETPVTSVKHKFDVAWCHDSFQYAIDPLSTLRLWNDTLVEDGMMILTLPQTTNMEHNYQAFDSPSFCYFNWTLTSLMYALAVSGFDCAGGFILKEPDTAWLNAIVYTNNQGPFNPKTTSW